MKSNCHSDLLFRDQLGHIRCNYCLNINPKTKTFRIAYIALFSLFLMSYSLIANKEHSNSYKYTFSIAKDTCDIELTDKSLLAELIKDSCVLPNVALAQAKIETNYYKSYKAINSKNLFGIKIHRCKYIVGEYNFQAVYKTYRENIACYCEIQRSYLNSINGHYAQNPKYVALIKQIK